MLYIASCSHCEKLQHFIVSNFLWAFLLSSQPPHFSKVEKQHSCLSVTIYLSAAKATKCASLQADSLLTMEHQIEFFVHLLILKHTVV